MLRYPSTHSVPESGSGRSWTDPRNRLPGRPILTALLLSALLAIPSYLRAEQACSPRPLTGIEEVAAYIQKTGKLPPNFIRKKEARKLGWKSSSGNLNNVAPCRSIGGDRFSNREGKLPDRPGRIWYEADIDYHGGRRGSKRIIFSNDGLIYRTFDHYRTFQKIL